ncbi:MAG: DUF1016 domain-containing protein [Pleurocapsa sp. SU_196_0]|nr:DUF1016 domain-containing protein [Pleurocapsa sp. SU_196_0]
MLEVSLEGYESFLRDLKTRIGQTQVRAALAVSRELVALYWQLGKDITEAQSRYTWGDKVLERIAVDLKVAFPGVEGFSRTNLYRMRVFYRAYPEIVPQAVGQIPWGHNVVLLEKLKESDQRLWYAHKTFEPESKN